MFERFTERARRVVVLAQEEARVAKSMVMVDHLILGLIREEGGLAGRVLSEMGVTEDDIRNAIPKPVKEFEDPSPPPMTGGAKKALELALREALALGHNYIGTEHILLGIGREKGERRGGIGHFTSSQVRDRVLVALTPIGSGGIDPEPRADSKKSSPFDILTEIVELQKTIAGELQSIHLTLKRLGS